MSSSKPAKASTIKQKLREALAKLRKTPVVTPEQKLHLKLDTLKSQATNLNTQASHLLTQTTTFTSRASSTPLPNSPPSDREPLFERHPTSGPPSSYDAQVRAYETLTTEWKEFLENDVKSWEKELEQFEKVLGNLREKHFDSERKVGEMEHEFIGLGNAVHNLKLQRTEIRRAVEGGGLPKEGGGGDGN
ncbi:hypothetical protein CBER1_07438 [Cercospora berteroae]|uniref:Uncharacterized protein n=1 Tax=Cercospora berteroae TaxID=357750 RepID=A0A2S6C7Z6_9PEZI|nr:hypothetical protein CBER1_07438 [Cercospora berteroae]